MPKTDIGRNDKTLMESIDHSTLIAELEKQIDVLITWTNRANKHFLLSINSPGRNSTARPEVFSVCLLEEMQLVLLVTHDGTMYSVAVGNTRAQLLFTIASLRFGRYTASKRNPLHSDKHW